ISPGASGTLLALVEIRSGRDNEVFAQEQRRRDMLRWVAGLEYDSDVRRRLRLSLRITANVASSVRDAAAENEATSMVLEWPPLAPGMGQLRPDRRGAAAARDSGSRSPSRQAGGGHPRRGSWP